MKNLPKIQAHNELVQAVNARELHAFLQNKDHFATWIKDRIAQYDFQENQDFMVFSENSEKGRPRLEYALTLDMAKELSMVERNEQGKQARRYFIECEKALRAVQSPKLSQKDYTELTGIIRQITQQMTYESAMSMAVYARLRHICQVESIKHIRYEQLGMVKGELSRIARILRPYQRQKQMIENTLIKRVCMGDDDSVWWAIREIDNTATSYADEIDDYLANFIGLDNWGQA